MDMTVTAKFYGQALMSALAGKINWASDDIRVMLYTSAYTPNQDTDIYKDVVNPTEASGTGYTTGGAALASKTITYNATTNVITLDAADVTWGTSTITARGCIIFDNTPASNKPLLGYVDFGADQSSNAGNFTITWDANGLFTITAS
jgi:hypothetical protein